MTERVERPADILDLVGKDLGTTEWVTVTQDQVNLFADATGDHQWIHTDPERAASGPFKGTIAHGFLTLSFIPKALEDVLVIDKGEAMINYGLNKVRFPAPVPVGSKVRGTVRVVSAQQRPAGVETVFNVTFESDSASKPVCVAEWIVIFR